MSAFANSEGGILVIGVAERKGKISVADRIDGVDASAITPEWLQGTLESNVSPYLPGLRVRRVVLESGDRVVFVVIVPQGTTAYQASDRRYYGRSEYKVQPLPDHEVRLRMQRGRVAQATLVLREVTLFPKDEESFNQLSPFEITQVKALRDQFPPELDGVASESCSVQSFVKNTGELTVERFALRMAWNLPGSIDVSLGSEILGLNSPYERTFRSGAPLLPGEEVALPADVWTISWPDVEPDAVHATARLDWTLYLHDAPSVQGFMVYENPRAVIT